MRFTVPTIDVEFDGNNYELPAGLSPGLRITAGDRLANYESVREKYLGVVFDIELTTEPGYWDDKTSAERKEQTLAFAKQEREAALELANAAREVIQVLAKSKTPKGKVPADFSLIVDDAAALEYVATLTEGRRVEVDPQ